MSSMIDKLEPADIARFHSSKARAWLRRHLTYANGAPRYNVLESDKQGPTRVSTLNRMDNTVTTWKRIQIDGKDSLFEQE